MSNGRLIVLSAPSGTGKTSVCRALLKRNPDWTFSISVTTREPREGACAWSISLPSQYRDFRRREGRGDTILD